MAKTDIRLRIMAAGGAVGTGLSVVDALVPNVLPQVIGHVPMGVATIAVSWAMAECCHQGRAVRCDLKLCRNREQACQSCAFCSSPNK